MAGTPNDTVPTAPRQAELVLLSARGELLGKLPPVDIATPWWQETGDVVDAVMGRFGLRVTVLRLLAADRAAPPGGRVTYLAELQTANVPTPELAPWTAPLPDHRLRLPYARPGGPARDLAWAHHELAAAGYRGPATSRQVRTWNLSSIWRLEHGDARFWLKVVPPFFAHEGTVIELLRDEAAPRAIATDGTRILLADTAGEDRYGASIAELRRMIELLVDLQWRWRTRVELLQAKGVPWWQPGDYEQRARDLLARHASELTAGEQTVLTHFTAELPRRMGEIARCGLPLTLVHGDFHPGNVRSDGSRLTILDWGDCCIGNPLLDLPPLLERLGAPAREAILQHWQGCWRAHIPQADIEHATRLIAPLSALRRAMVYRHFLDEIEPSEQVYHRDDPAIWLRKAAALLGAA